jgi:SAM-dependent MidA family methyltransferase
MPVAEFMRLCLGDPEHGYYMTRDPFGAAGDFVTAPEISQMFGELLGAWVAQVWVDQGRPDPFLLAELGPGRGTLMRDVLRATSGVPGFRSAARVWLVESSPALRARQAAVLEGAEAYWAGSVAELPDGPLIVLANEFFDALPVHQFQRLGMAWRERNVTLEQDRLAFSWSRPRADALLEARFAQVPDGALIEVSAEGEAVAAALGAQISAHGGAALVVDYGQWDGTGDTLQALAGGARADPLDRPGEADLTAHVRFRALAEAAGDGVAVAGPVPQGVFLERLGITARARILARGAEADAVAAAHRRLTHPKEMGNLFQVLAFMPRGAPEPPGFDP